MYDATRKKMMDDVNELLKRSEEDDIREQSYLIAFGRATARELMKITDQAELERIIQHKYTELERTKDCQKRVFAGFICQNQHCHYGQQKTVISKSEAKLCDGKCPICESPLNKKKDILVYLNDPAIQQQIVPAVQQVKEVEHGHQIPPEYFDSLDEIEVDALKKFFLDLASSKNKPLGYSVTITKIGTSRRGLTRYEPMRGFQQREIDLQKAIGVNSREALRRRRDRILLRFTMDKNRKSAYEKYVHAGKDPWDVFVKIMSDIAWKSSPEYTAQLIKELQKPLT